MFQLINYHEIDADMLCKYIEQKIHTELRNHVVLAKEYVYQHLYDASACTTLFELLGMLLSKIEEELECVFRKETLILFPLAKIKEAKLTGNAFGWAEKTPAYHTKLLNLVEKMRQLTHNYQIKQEWTSAAKLGVNELYEFDYHLQNWLQLEQAILFPKLQKLSLSADN